MEDPSWVAFGLWRYAEETDVIPSAKQTMEDPEMRDGPASEVQWQVLSSFYRSTAELWAIPLGQN